jgi:micrococcal nuclease
LLALLAVNAAACGRITGSTTTSQTRAPTTRPQADDGGTTTTDPATTATAPDRADPGVLVQVLDGDSLEIEIGGTVEEVRLLGINTPEREECHDGPAREAAIALTDAGEIAVDDAGGRDRYGRLLAYVYADGSLVNLELLESGAAIALSNDHPLLDTFLEAEERAFSHGIGMWAVDACGDPGDAPVAISVIEYDPRGPDEDNLEDEYVSLVNDGAAAADLEGWTLRDESSTHRYSFPGGFTLGSGDEVRVRTGCGNDDHNDLFWCERDPVWSNGGDTVLLLDRSGNVVDRYRYFG